MEYFHYSAGSMQVQGQKYGWRKIGLSTFFKVSFLRVYLLGLVCKDAY